MRVLSIVHADDAGPGSFADVVRERGHEHVEWRIDSEPPPDRPFDAVLVFGGVMNTHEEEDHPWLVPENEVIRRTVEQGVPLLGVCLGGQLLAKALGAPVLPAREPEIGWHEVVRTDESAHDPVVGALPERFSAFQWHSYEFALPENAVPLAANPVCLQAYRAGERAWGVQFHPEVTRKILQEWIDEARASGYELDFDALEQACDAGIARWRELGRTLCESFLAVAEKASPARPLVPGPLVVPDARQAG